MYTQTACGVITSFEYDPFVSRNSLGLASLMQWNGKLCVICDLRERERVGEGAKEREIMYQLVKHTSS